MTRLFEKYHNGAEYRVSDKYGLLYPYFVYRPRILLYSIGLVVAFHGAVGLDDNDHGYAGHGAVGPDDNDHGYWLCC